MRKILILFFVLANIECSKNPESNHKAYLKKIEIDPKTAETGYLSDIADSVQFVPLETTQKSLIGNVEKILVNGDQVFIMDTKLSKAVFVFDLNGRFRYKIDKAGKGVGEYSKLGDFIVCDKYIELYDENTRNILKYNISNGSYISTLHVDLWFKFFEKTDNEDYIIQTRKMVNFYKSKPLDYDLIFISDQRKIRNKYFPYDSKLKVNNVAFDLPKVFTRCRNDLYFAKLFLDTVYKVQNNSLVPVFYFDYGKYKLTQNYLTMPSDKIKEKLKYPGDEAFGHVIHCVNDQYIFFTFGFKEDLTDPQNWYFGIFFQNEKRSKIYSRLINDVYDTEIEIPITKHPIAHYNDKLVFLLNPYDIATYIDKNKIAVNNELNIDKYANPVLMFVTIKTD